MTDDKQIGPTDIIQMGLDEAYQHYHDLCALEPDLKEESSKVEGTLTIKEDKILSLPTPALIKEPLKPWHKTGRVIIHWDGEEYQFNESEWYHMITEREAVIKSILIDYYSQDDDPTE